LAIGPETYYDKLEEIKTRVSAKFSVREISFREGVLTFEISDQDIKKSFKELYRELDSIGYIPTAQKSDFGIRLRIFPRPQVRTQKSRVPLILLIATLVTIFVDGYIRTTGIQSILGLGPVTLEKLLRDVSLYTVAIIGIIGIHEMGHKVFSKIDKIDSSPPYFIPGVPGLIPTFGAVIFQKGPIVNRDDLFDSGVSGPVTGFIASIVVLFIAFNEAAWITVEEARKLISSGEIGVLPSPLIFELTNKILGKPGLVPVFPLIGFAAWLGMVVTSLNLLPIWQLDGGRIFRSITGPKTHSILSYATIGLLILTGYIPLALLLLLFMRNPAEFAILDNVSPLSLWRKLSIAGIIAMIFVTFVVLPGSLLSPQLGA
jgi:membrane-associated protease RseP (regulator of RpoE activity)